MLLTPGCEKKGRNADEEGLGLPDTTSTGKEVAKMGEFCQVDKPVSKAGEAGTPETIVYELLSASVDEGDEEAAFERFYAQFEASQKKDWVKSQYWKAARKNTGVLVDTSGGGVSYTVCRTSGSGKRTKIFVKSTDIDKGHVPVSLKKDDEGAWKVTSFKP